MADPRVMNKSEQSELPVSCHNHETILWKRQLLKLKSLIKKSFQLHLHHCDTVEFSKLSLEAFG